MSSKTEHPTKERIIEAAERLMLEKSFHSVGLNELLRTVEIPKGSFYHHFASKEQFGVEMLKHYSSESVKMKRSYLLDSEISSIIERFRVFFETGISNFQANGMVCPCLIIKLASEVSSFSEPMRETLAEGLENWNRVIAEALSLGIKKGELAPSLKPRETALLIGALWTGSVQQAIILKSIAPLVEVRDHILRQILLPA